MRQDDFDSSPVVMWYGKIPAMGDFVRRRMPEPILLPWERWFSSGVSQIDAANNSLTTGDGQQWQYDYLVLCTGPRLAFDLIPGAGPEHFTQSICHVDHAVKAYDAYLKLLESPGPVLVGAVQGASCFGPAYEYVLTLEHLLRKKKIRDRVPITFVTSEPYIGHLGLDGVGDTKGLLESEMRAKHIKWMTSTRVKKVEEGKMTVEEVGEDGVAKPEKVLPFAYSMMLPAFRGIKPVAGIEGLSNPRGFTIVDKHQRNPKYPNVFAVGVCVAQQSDGGGGRACAVGHLVGEILGVVGARRHHHGQCAVCIDAEQHRFSQI